LGGDGFPRSAPEAASTPAQADDIRLADALSGKGRWLALLGFFAAGLGLAFTPCVLPMIPILSGLIATNTSAARDGRIGTGRAFSLSLVYVLASAAVFTLAGVVAGLVGANLQIVFQTPWVLVLFAALFLALALSMFGLYELQLPASWRARLGALSDGQRGGSWAGVAAMGALSALIVGPCVAPPLAAAVLYIGQTRDPVFGGFALFLLALGMGAPLLAFGVAAGRGLPTSGPWMVAVQRVFGFVFIGMAVWMLSRILPGAATLALYGVLALAFAAWLLALAAPPMREGRRWALRCAGAVFALVGAAQLLGALAGGHDPLQPLAGVFGTRQAQRELPFRTIKSLADLDREVAAANAAGKPLLFDFYADWCVACKEMEKYTFPRPEVQAALDGFVLLKADVTANDATDQALMRRLGIVGPPATLFYVDGAERRGLRLFGFERAEAFVRRVEQAK
jgi:thiol:disulfide interchange protein DsbD